MVQEQVAIDDDDDDEFEPLFSYNRVCRPPSGDDSDEDVCIVGGKTLQKKDRSNNRSSLLTTTCPSHKRGFDDVTIEVEDDDDWLPPPPKSAKNLLETKINEDPTVQQLRQEREELRRLAQKYDEDRKAEKTALELQESSVDVADEPVCAPANREKVLVTIQNKDGACKNFRVFKDEKFEKLFMRYAESINVPLQQLVFLFDGEKVPGSNTPKDMDIEDEDIIEVNIKK